MSIQLLHIIQRCSFRSTDRIWRVLFVTMLFFSLQSCERGHQADCFKGLGDIITVNKSIEAPFDRIVANGRIRVNLVQDSLNFLEITCGENLVEGIEFNVIDNTLNLDDKNRCHWVRDLSQVPLITVHYTTLKYFGAENYGDNRFMTPHRGDTLLTEYWTGSGITYYNGYVNEAYFKVHAGSGGFVASGGAQLCYVFHGGGSRIDVSDFTASQVLVTTLSNNDIYVACDSILSCDIRRTGNVFYSGNPTQIIRNGMGSGQIIQE